LPGTSIQACERQTQNSGLSHASAKGLQPANFLNNSGEIFCRREQNGAQAIAERFPMMGYQQDVQEHLFYAFNLEDHVPKDHLLRVIDRLLDLGNLRQYLADFYSHTGRPTIEPELMIRMLIIGYCFGIRSEHRLCEEVHVNLAYR
jgi:hypothetical protein